MGLKQDLIDAKVKAASEFGMDVPGADDGSYLEREAHYTTEAIIKFLTE